MGHCYYSGLGPVQSPPRICESILARQSTNDNQNMKWRWIFSSIESPMTRGAAICLQYHDNRYKVNWTEIPQAHMPLSHYPLKLCTCTPFREPQYVIGLLMEEDFISPIKKNWALHICPSIGCPTCVPLPSTQLRVKQRDSISTLRIAKRTDNFHL